MEKQLVSAPTSAKPLSGDLQMKIVERLVLFGLFLLVAIDFHLIFVQNLNWDEFFFLSFVHDHLRGSLAKPVQTFHVHLFAWLASWSGNEISQILMGRGVMYLLTLGTCFFIYAISRSFHSRPSALLSVMFFLGFSYVLEHGFSFRADPICTFLFMAALYCIRNQDRSRLVLPAAAVLMALAMAISIKSVFYLVTAIVILSIVAFHARDGARSARNIPIFLLVFAGAYALMFFGHQATLAEAPLAESYSLVQNAGLTTLLFGEYFPRGAYVIRSLQENPIIWMFLLASVVAVVPRVRIRTQGKDAMFLLALAIPLLSLVFYRNAFPYFFVLLMAPLAVLGGAGPELLIGRMQQTKAGVSTVLLALTVVGITIGAVATYVGKLPDQTVAQAKIVRAVHRMFPKPVAYIDRNSMISSFPKVGFFMSTWGMEAYHGANKAIMYSLLKRKQPKFLIANTPVLEISASGSEDRFPEWYRLFDEDRDTLRGHFVHHWGPIFVAGKAFDFGPDAAPVSFEVLIAGSYILEAAFPVLIDGTTYRPGDRVRLDQGGHAIAPTETQTRVVLRWGEDLYRPTDPPSSKPIYYGF